MITEKAEKIKELFDLCESIGEGVHGKIHICNTSEDGRFPDEDCQYRIYHADGYCFDVRKEEVDLSEDDDCDTCIDGYEYSFMEGIYEGFKEIQINEAIELLKSATMILRFLQKLADRFDKSIDKKVQSIEEKEYRYLMSKQQRTMKDFKRIAEIEKENPMLKYKMK